MNQTIDISSFSSSKKKEKKKHEYLFGQFIDDDSNYYIRNGLSKLEMKEKKQRKRNNKLNSFDAKEKKTWYVFTDKHRERK